MSAKETMHRNQPGNRDDDNFSSGSSSKASVSARLARHTLGYHELPPGARLSSDLGLMALPGMTG